MPKIPTLEQTFRSAAEKDVDLPRYILRHMHSLARETQNLHLGQEEARREARELRPRIIYLTKQIKRAQELQREVAHLVEAAETGEPDKKLRSRPSEEEPSHFYSLIPEVRMVQELTHRLEQRRDKLISRTHSRLRRPYKPKWEGFNLTYPLERFGFNAPRSWFLINAYEPLLRHFRKAKKPAPMRSTWAALAALMEILFDEKPDDAAVNIERLIRTMQRKKLRE